MLAIEMRGITKSFAGFVANHSINLQVQKGEIHCLLGENGAGKTTLMNILFGLYRADEGEIFINGASAKIGSSSAAFELGLGMVHQHFMLIHNLTVLENIILGQECGSLHLDMKKARKRVQDLSERYRFGLDLNQKVGELSVGMMQRVEIIKTVYRGADIMILDEPTAVLAPQEADALLQILSDMRAQGKTIVFITHKLGETMRIADSVTVLRGGVNVASALPVAETNERQLAGMMVGRDVNRALQREPLTAGDEILRVEEARLLPNAASAVSFQVRAGEIFGVAGVDGNGQQQLEEGLMGLHPFSQGTVLLGGLDIRGLNTRKRRLRGMAHIPSDRLKRGVVASFSLEDNYLLGNQYRKGYCKKGMVNYAALRARAADHMVRFDVKATGLTQTLGSLSGGNQQKLVLSREVSEDPCLIVAAQPIRGLDIGAIEHIHQTLLELRSQGKAILLISGELSELMSLSDRIGVLYKGEFMDIRPTEDYTTEEIGLLMAGKKGDMADGYAAQNA